MPTPGMMPACARLAALTPWPPSDQILTSRTRAGREREGEVGRGLMRRGARQRDGRAYDTWHAAMGYAG